MIEVVGLNIGILIGMTIAWLAVNVSPALGWGLGYIVIMIILYLYFSKTENKKRAG